MRKLRNRNKHNWKLIVIKGIIKESRWNFNNALKTIKGKWTSKGCHEVGVILSHLTLILPVWSQSTESAVGADQKTEERKEERIHVYI